MTRLLESARPAASDSEQEETPTRPRALPTSRRGAGVRGAEQIVLREVDETGDDAVAPTSSTSATVATSLIAALGGAPADDRPAPVTAEPPTARTDAAGTPADLPAAGEDPAATTGPDRAEHLPVPSANAVTPTSTAAAGAPTANGTGDADASDGAAGDAAVVEDAAPHDPAPAAATAHGANDADAPDDATALSAAPTDAAALDDAAPHDPAPAAATAHGANDADAPDDATALSAAPTDAAALDDAAPHDAAHGAPTANGAGGDADALSAPDGDSAGRHDPSDDMVVGRFASLATVPRPPTADAPRERGVEGPADRTMHEQPSPTAPAGGAATVDDGSDGEDPDAAARPTGATPDTALDPWTTVAQVTLLLIGALAVVQTVVLIIVGRVVAAAGVPGGDITAALTAHGKVITVMLPALVGGALAALALAVWRVRVMPASESDDGLLQRRVATLPLPLWAVAGATLTLLIVALAGSSATIVAAQRTTFGAVLACALLAASCLVAPRSLVSASADGPDEPDRDASDVSKPLAPVG